MNDYNMICTFVALVIVVCCWIGYLLIVTHDDDSF
jgi:hypothetical protein